ncbi:2'-5' RNA ligase family protein [Lentzea flaviverrucosa]|uniref:2'-5' RNA ligase family protein n=1 Tax=Lentzea flaviverrucosa TaxID=200379 RepID=UPI000B7EDE81|nr:2'-5' RNA ligase family protein [Lentzea flaviverrucosa]
MYTFFLTFEDDLRSSENVQYSYRALANAPELDIVRPRWMHITVQGVGFVDEVEPLAIEKLTGVIRQKLCSVGPLCMTLGPAVVAQEGVVLLTSHTVEMQRLQAILRDGIAEVLSEKESGFGAPLEPHVTLAYSHGVGSTEGVKSSLRGSEELFHQVTFNSIRLVILGRDDQTYTWTTAAKIPLE